MADVSKDMRDTFFSIAMYNGYGEELIPKWIERLKNYLAKPQSIRLRFYPCLGDDYYDSNNQNDFSDGYFYGQAEILNMMLVFWFGGYGTSPRSGWIEKQEECLKFLEDIKLEYDFADYLNGYAEWRDEFEKFTGGK